MRFLSLFFVILYYWCAANVFAQGKSADDYVRILRNGNSLAKFNAAKDILQFDLIHEKLESRLLRELRRNKEIERNKVYLEAYLLQVDDPAKEQKGYREFVKNVYSNKFPKDIDKVEAQLDVLTELTRLRDVRPSLLKYLQTEGVFGRYRKLTPIYIIQQLLKEHPNFAKYYADQLPKNADYNLGMMLLMDKDGLSNFVEQIRGASEIAPANALYLLQRAGAITETEIELAVSKIAPIGFWQIYSDELLPNAVAAEILAANVEKFNKASDALVNMINENHFQLFRHAITTHPIYDPAVNDKILNALMSKLAEIDYSNAAIKSSVCLFLRHFDIHEERHINSIVFTARFAATPLVRSSCTIALTKVKTKTSDLQDYISNLQLDDAADEIDKIERFGDVGKVLLKQHIRRGKKYDYTVFNPVNGPDFSLLYKAGIYLTFDIEDKTAWEILESFYNAEVDYVRQIRDIEHNQLNQFRSEIPIGIFGFRDRLIYAIDVTPMDIIAGVKRRKNDYEWRDFILSNLTTKENVRTLNAAILINQYGITLDKRFEEKLLDLAADDESGQLIYLRSLKYLQRTKAVSEFLQDRVKSNNRNIAKIAMELLSESPPLGL